MAWDFSPRNQALWGIVLLLAVGTAGSQNVSSHSSGNPHHRGGSSPKGSPGVPGVRVAPKPAQPPAPQAVGVITDTGFAGRLGNTVGSRGWPSVPLQPGVNRINHPGLQPMPHMQPFPGGFSNPLPTVNRHGGSGIVQAPSGGFGRHPRHGHSGRSTSGVIFYGVPYYVPYYVYPGDNSTALGAAGTSGAGYSSSNLTAGSSPEGEARPAEADGEVLTLLAFKDSTVVIVVDYWLEGTWLYYILPSLQRLSVPLDRLDQPLTQQLNRERNVSFILQAR